MVHRAALCLRFQHKNYLKWTKTSQLRNCHQVPPSKKKTSSPNCQMKPIHAERQRRDRLSMISAEKTLSFRINIEHRVPFFARIETTVESKTRFTPQNIIIYINNGFTCNGASVDRSKIDCCTWYRSWPRDPAPTTLVRRLSRPPLPTIFPYCIPIPSNHDRELRQRAAAKQIE